MYYLKAIVCGLFSMALLVGCSTTSPNNPVVSPANTNSADIKTTQADSILENVFSSNPTFSTLDVSAANKLYSDAIALNPANTKAQFGAAITDLLTSTRNHDFQTFVDSLQVSTPSPSGLFKSAIIPVKLTGNAIASPEKIVLRLASANAAQVPKISTLQKAVNDSILPKFDYALARLAVIESDPNFVFKITPKMRGDASSPDTFNLDNGEIFVIDAGLRIIKASLLALISYNVDVDMNGSYSWLQTSAANFSVDSFDIAFLKQLLTPGSSFLTLNSWGQASMQGVSTNMRASLSKLQSAVNEIKNEKHDQSHDIIKLSYVDSADTNLKKSNSGYGSLVSIIDTVTKALSGPYLFKKDSVSVTLNVTAPFDHPIQDLKTKFPRYTWIDPSHWRTVSVLIDYYYNGTSDVLDTVYDTTVANPFRFQNANGDTLSFNTITFDQMDFPDYTFGGLFPNLTTKTAWDNFITAVNNSDLAVSGSSTEPTSPTASSNPVIALGNSFSRGFPLAKLFK